HRLDILDVRPWIDAGTAVCATFASQFQDPRTEAPEEHAVVRHEHHRTFEIFEPIDQHLLSGKVQVIGRLVEYQTVRRGVGDPRYHEPRFLAAGERTDRFVDMVSRELELSSASTKRADSRF